MNLHLRKNGTIHRTKTIIELKVDAVALKRIAGPWRIREIRLSTFTKQTWPLRWSLP